MNTRVKTPTKSNMHPIYLEEMKDLLREGYAL